MLSGESATLQVVRTIHTILPPNLSGGTTVSTSSSTTSSLSNGTSAGGWVSVLTGPTLNITPTITPDKKHVLLYISAELQSLLGYDTSTFQVPIVGTNGAVTNYPYTVTLPQTERSRVKTRVSVPDGGTLLLGGNETNGLK